MNGRLILLLIIQCTGRLLPASDICSANSLKPIYDLKIPGVPSYFFRPLPDSNLIYLSGYLKNYVIDVASGREGPLPGYFDAVPNEEDLSLIPEPGCKSNCSSSMVFYNTEELLTSINPSYLYKDEDFHGLYQSVGTLWRIGNVRTIRVFTADHGGRYRDYRVTKGESVKPVSEPQKICQGYDLRLPMLSKNGSELAALDLETNTTKIFRIERDNSCSEVLDLGIATGKVDFSYDGKKLAFHVQREHEAGEWFQIPGDEHAMNSYVYDRETGGTKPLTSNVNGISYFPGFRRNGNVVYFHQDADGSSYVREVNPDQSEEISLDRFHNCDEQTKHAQFAIGRLMQDFCQIKSRLNEYSARMMALSLDREVCNDLVKSEWETNRGNILSSASKQKNTWAIFRKHLGISADRLEGIDLDVLASISRDELLAVCDENTASVVKKADIKTNSTEISGSRIASTRCAVCHVDVPFNDQERFKQTEFAAKVRELVKSGRMPPEGELNGDEQAKLFEYLGL